MWSSIRLETYLADLMAPLVLIKYLEQGVSTYQKAPLVYNYHKLVNLMNCCVNLSQLLPNIDELRQRH